MFTSNSCLEPFFPFSGCGVCRCLSRRALPSDHRRLADERCRAADVTVRTGNPNRPFFHATIFRLLLCYVAVSFAMTWALIARGSPDGVPRSRDLNQNFPSVSSLTRKSESFDLRLRLEFSSLLSSLEADHFLGLLY